METTNNSNDDNTAAIERGFSVAGIMLQANRHRLSDSSLATELLIAYATNILFSNDYFCNCR